MRLYVSTDHTVPLVIRQPRVIYDIGAVNYTSTFEVDWTDMSQSDKDAFEDSFIQATAIELGVSPEDIVIHEITAGSAVVDASVYVQEGSAVTTDSIETKLTTAPISVTHNGVSVGSTVSNLKKGFASRKGEKPKKLAKGAIVTPSDITTSSVVLTWTDDDNGEATVQKYVIYANDVEKGEVSADISTFTVEGLDPDTDYTFKVRKVTDLGEVDSTGMYVTQAEFNILHPSEATLSVVSSTGTSIRFRVDLARTLTIPISEVFWVAYESDSLTSYDPDSTPISDFDDDLPLNPSPTTTFDFDMNFLTAGKAYHTIITLKQGYNRFIQLPMIVGAAVVPPDTPTINFVSATHDSLTFDVSLGSYNDAIAVGDAEFGCRQGSSGIFPVHTILDQTTTQVTITGLTLNTSYSVRIKKWYSINGGATVPLIVQEDDVYTTDGLKYRWDFGASTDYTAEKVTGEPALVFEEGSGDPFRGQYVDDFGRKGIIAGNNIENVFNGIQYAGNTGIRVVANQSIKDSLDMGDMSVVVNFSIRDDYYLYGVRRTDVRFGFNMLYDTTFSADLNDPNQGGGFSFGFHSKDTKTLFRAYSLETDPATGEFLNPQTSSIYTTSDLTYSNAYKQHPGTDGVRFIPIRDGQYPFDVTGGGKQVTYVSKLDRSSGLHTFKIYFCQTLLLAKTLNQNSTEFQLYKNSFKNLISITETGETWGDSLMNIYDVSVYSREIQVSEMAPYVPHFQFKYHYISDPSDYVILGSAIKYTGKPQNYVEMQNDDVYRASAYYLMEFPDFHWREYELQYHSGAVGVEFFNVTSTTVYAAGDDYFAVSYPGIAFGIIAGALKYRVGSSLVDTGVSVSPGDRKFISVYMGPDSIKFYYDKTLVGTVTNDGSSSFWVDVGTAGVPFSHSWFNLGTSTANRLYHLVKHTDTNLDLGTSLNALL